MLLCAACLLAIACFSCGDDSTDGGGPRLDLAEIRERGVLRAITTFSSTSYFIHRGRTMGYEYELLQRFAEHIGVDLEIVVTDDLEQLFTMLQQGEGDLVAQNLPAASDPDGPVVFTVPHMSTHQVLVQRKPEQWRRMKRREIDQLVVRDPIDLIGRTVHVRRGSPYVDRLTGLTRDIGGEIAIEVVEGNVSTEALIRMVAEGRIDYTVADENLAYMFRNDYPILDVETRLSQPQRIAWAVRTSSPDLLETINRWLVQMKQTADYYTIYNKYFRNRTAFRRATRAVFTGVHYISPFDSVVQFHAARINWDWRLLSALIYQESQFDPEAQSYAGACGLMQMMPTTAELYGVSGADIFDPSRSIEAGASYLAYLRKLFKEIPDTLEQIKFALAAYNVGVAHVQDAQRLAAKYGEDPFMWTDNVEEYMLLKSDPVYYSDDAVQYGYSRGSEPVAFVRDIISRFEHYKRVAPAVVTSGQVVRGQP